MGCGSTLALCAARRASSLPPNGATATYNPTACPLSSVDTCTCFNWPADIRPEQRRHATINGQCSSGSSSSLIKKSGCNILRATVATVISATCCTVGINGSEATANKPSAISQNITAKNLPPIKDCCLAAYATRYTGTTALCALREILQGIWIYYYYNCHYYNFERNERRLRCL